jgi:hypothetical protein
MRVVRLANAVAPHSGGMRTALRELGAGYLRAGHDPVLVVPGPRSRDELTEQGRVITVPGPLVPGTGGYRVITARRSLRRLLERLAPDRLEVSDRTTLRWTGAWARANGVRSVMVSHESLAGLLRVLGPPGVPSQWPADRMNRAKPGNPDPTFWASARWMATKGTGWLIRRSRDLLPRLVQLVLKEWWHGVRDQGAQLDAQLRSELDSVLRHLGSGPSAGDDAQEYEPLSA